MNNIIDRIILLYRKLQVCFLSAPPHFLNSPPATFVLVSTISFAWIKNNSNPHFHSYRPSFILCWLSSLFSFLCKVTNPFYTLTGNNFCTSRRIIFIMMISLLLISEQFLPVALFLSCLFHPRVLFGFSASSTSARVQRDEFVSEELSLPFLLLFTFLSSNYLSCFLYR